MSRTKWIVSGALAVALVVSVSVVRSEEKAAAREAGPDADVPLFVRNAASQPVTPPVHGLERSARLVMAGLAALLLWIAGTLLGERPQRDFVQGLEERTDAGEVAVGDSAVESSRVSIHPPTSGSSVAMEVPPRPFPGQTRPDASGRCPIDSQVAIHGGCWWRLEVSVKDCPLGNYVYKGKCYAPAAPLPPPPTSGPSESPDGG